MPSQCSMASTVVPFMLGPLSPCSTGRRLRAWMPSASAVRRTRCAACSAWSVVVHLEADDLAAEQIEDEVEVEPAALQSARQVGDIPAPDLARRGRHMGAGRADAPGRAGPAAAPQLAMVAQHPMEAGFAGEVATLVGQCRDDAGRRHVGETVNRIAVHRWPRRRCAPAPPRSGRAMAWVWWPWVGGRPALRPHRRASAGRSGRRCRPRHRQAPAGRRRRRRW